MFGRTPKHERLQKLVKEHTQTIKDLMDREAKLVKGLTAVFRDLELTDESGTPVASEQAVAQFLKNLIDDGE